MKEREARTFRFAIRLAIAVALLVALTQIVDVSSTIGTMRELPPSVFATAVLLAVARVPIGAMRWSVLDPNDDVAFAEYLRYLMTNNFVNILMPMLAGDAARAAHTKADGQRTSTAVSVFTDRAIGAFSILGLGLVALIVSEPFKGRITLFVVLSLLFGSGFAGFLLASRLFNNTVRPIDDESRLGRILSLAGEVLDFYQRHRVQVLKALALCVPLHFLWFVLVWVLASSLEIPIGFWELTTYTSLVMAVTAIPVSLNGLGVREIGYAALFASQGIAVESAVALSLYQFVIMLTLGLIGLPFFLVGGSTQDDG